MFEKRAELESDVKKMDRWGACVCELLYSAPLNTIKKLKIRHACPQSAKPGLNSPSDYYLLDHSTLLINSSSPSQENKFEVWALDDLNPNGRLEMCFGFPNPNSRALIRGNDIHTVNIPQMHSNAREAPLFRPSPNRECFQLRFIPPPQALDQHQLNFYVPRSLFLHRFGYERAETIPFSVWSRRVILGDNAIFIRNPHPIRGGRQILFSDTHIKTGDLVQPRAAYFGKEDARRERLMFGVDWNDRVIAPYHISARRLVDLLVDENTLYLESVVIDEERIVLVNVSYRSTKEIPTI